MGDRYRLSAVFLRMAKSGWYHDRIRPFIGEECGVFNFIRSVEKDMNHFGSFTREQDHGWKSCSERVDLPPSSYRRGLHFAGNYDRETVIN